MKRFWPVLCLIAFGLLRVWQLWSYDYALGRDAYWYIIQAQSLLQTGELHASAWTPLHHIVSAVMYVLPDASIAMELVQFAGWMLTVAALMLLTHAFSAGIQSDSHAVGRTVGAGPHGSNGAPPWWLLPIALSASLWFFVLQYPAQLYSFTFYVLMLVCLEYTGRACVRHTNRREQSAGGRFVPKRFWIWTTAALVCALLSVWMHRTGIVWIGATVLAIGVHGWFLRTSLPQKLRTRPALLLILPIVVFLLITMGITLLFVYPGPLYWIERVPDLERLYSALSTEMYPVLLRLWSTGDRAMGLESGVFLMMMIIGLFLYRRRLFSPSSTFRRSNRIENIRRPFLIFWTLAFCILQIPLFDFFDLQIRLLLPALCIAPVVLIVIWREGFVRLRRTMRALVGVLLLLYAALQLFTFSYAPYVFPYAAYDDIIERVRQTHRENDSALELMIVHRGFAEYFKYRTGVDALPWSPEESLRQSIGTDRIHRLVYGITPAELRRFTRDYDGRRAAPLEGSRAASIDRRWPAPIDMGHGYTLITENRWRYFVERAANDPLMPDRIYHWQNPHRERPGFLK